MHPPCVQRKRNNFQTVICAQRQSLTGTGGNSDSFRDVSDPLLIYLGRGFTLEGRTEQLLAMPEILHRFAWRGFTQDRFEKPNFVTNWVSIFCCFFVDSLTVVFFCCTLKWQSLGFGLHIVIVIMQLGLKTEFTNDVLSAFVSDGF